MLRIVCSRYRSAFREGVTTRTTSRKCLLLEPFIVLSPFRLSMYATTMFLSTPMVAQKYLRADRCCPECAFAGAESRGVPFETTAPSETAPTSPALTSAAHEQLV